MSLDWLKDRYKVGDQHTLGQHTGDMTPMDDIEAARWESNPDKLHELLDPDQPFEIRDSAANSKHLNASHVDKGLYDNSDTVRESVIKSLAATPDQIHRALNYSHRIARAAIQNPNATKENIDKALLGKYPMVRDIATEHPIYRQHYPNGHEIIDGKIVPNKE
jgi:hypothetical protein